MSTILITGADGHLGKAIAHRLLIETEQDLLLFVRATTDTETHIKIKRLGDLASDARCRVVPSDLRDSQPFAAIDASAVTGIVHSAAATSFAVDRQTAHEVNIEGTQKLLDFADRCSNLQRFGHISSVYSTGLMSGDIEESPVHSEPLFANNYEWSKWHAERLIVSRDNVPWQVCRLATLLAEDAAGKVVQQNAIHNTLRLLYYGLLSVLPGSPDTRVYMITARYAAEAVCKLFTDGESQQVYHVSAGGATACTLGQVIDTVYAAFSADPHFARLRILKPLFCDLESFDLLASGAEQSGGAVAQSLMSVLPFAPQLFNDKNVQVVRTSSALNGMQTPDCSSLLQNASEYLVRTRWGLRTESTEDPA